MAVDLLQSIHNFSIYLHLQSFSSSCIQPQIIPMSQTYINLILNGHNYYRNLTAGGGVVNLNPAVRMAKMTWSNELENMSQFFVNQCNPQLEDCHNTRKN